MFWSFRRYEMPEETSVNNDSNIDKLFDIKALGVTGDILTIVYFTMFIVAAAKLRQWYLSSSSPLFRGGSSRLKEHTFFHISAITPLLIRTLAFCILSAYGFFDMGITYPFVVMLFTLPEYTILTTYLIIILYWVETYVFAHHQYLISNSTTFRTRWKWAISFISMLLYGMLAFYYAYLVLMQRTQTDSDFIIGWILTSCAWANFSLPVLAICFQAFYFIYLTGFPFKTSIYADRSAKVWKLLQWWTVGRVTRGVILILSIKIHTLFETEMQNVIFASSIMLSEIVPIMLVFDWSIVGPLLLYERLMVGGRDPDQVHKTGSIEDDGNVYIAFDEESDHLSSNSNSGGGGSNGSGPPPTFNIVQQPLHNRSLSNNDGDGNLSMSTLYTESKDANNNMGVIRDGEFVSFSSCPQPKGVKSSSSWSMSVGMGMGFGMGAASAVSAAASRLAEWSIDPKEMKFSTHITVNNGVCFTQQGLINHKRVSLKAFRFQELNINDSIIDELCLDWVDASCYAHPHIVPLLGVCRVDTTIYQVSEFYPRGSLFEIIAASRSADEPLAPAFILNVLIGVASAMQYLHSFGHAHAYLKSRNVLIDLEGNARVGDIGIERLKSYAEVVLVTRMATAWSAPEILRGDIASSASDVYSFGVICWELLTQKEPQMFKTLDEIYYDVCVQEMRLELPPIEDVHPSLRDFFPKLVQHCTEQIPTMRPSFTSILAVLKSLAQTSQE